MTLWVKFILCVTFINVFGFFIMKNLTNNNNCFVVAGYLFLFSGIIALISLIYMHYFTNISVLKTKNIYGIILLAIMNFASYTLLLNAVNYIWHPIQTRRGSYGAPTPWEIWENKKYCILGSEGVYKSTFTANLKNERGQKLRKNILLCGGLVTLNAHFPQNRKVAV